MSDAALNVGIDSRGAVSGANTAVRSINDISAAANNLQTKLQSMEASMSKLGATSGISQAKAQLEAMASPLQNLKLELERIESRIVRIGATAIVIGVVTSAFGKLREVISGSIKAVDDFQTAVISISASLTQIGVINGSMDIAKTYREASVYAGAMAIKLQEIDKNSFANYKGLTAMLQVMTAQGQVLDINNKKQVQAFTDISNAIAIMTPGQNQEMQMYQEMRSLMTGRVDMHSQLSRSLDAQIKAQGIYKNGLKDVVALGREHGDLLERIVPYLQGINAASGDISKTWQAVKTSFETSLNALQREAFTPILKDLTLILKDFTKGLSDNAGVISGVVQAAWDRIKGVIFEVDAKTKEMKFSAEFLNSIKIIADIFKAIVDATSFAIKYIIEYSNAIKTLVELYVVLKVVSVATNVIDHFKTKITLINDTIFAESVRLEQMKIMAAEQKASMARTAEETAFHLALAEAVTAEAIAKSKAAIHVSTYTPAMRGVAVTGDMVRAADALNIAKANEVQAVSELNVATAIKAKTAAEVQGMMVSRDALIIALERNTAEAFYAEAALGYAQVDIAKARTIAETNAMRKADNLTLIETLTLEKESILVLQGKNIAYRESLVIGLDASNTRVAAELASIAADKVSLASKRSLIVVEAELAAAKARKGGLSSLAASSQAQLAALETAEVKLKQDLVIANDRLAISQRELTVTNDLLARAAGDDVLALNAQKAAQDKVNAATITANRLERELAGTIAFQAALTDKLNIALQTQAARSLENAVINAHAARGFNVLAAKEAEIALRIANANAIANETRATVVNGEAIAANTILTRGLVAAKTALRGVMTALGGPIGLILTALTLGATAWMIWGKNAKEAVGDNDVFDSVRKINDELDRQYEKLRAIDRMKNKDKGTPGTSHDRAITLLDDAQYKVYKDADMVILKMNESINSLVGRGEIVRKTVKQTFNGMTQDVETYVAKNVNAQTLLTNFYKKQQEQADMLAKAERNKISQPEAPKPFKQKKEDDLYVDDQTAINRAKAAWEAVRNAETANQKAWSELRIHEEQLALDKSIEQVKKAVDDKVTSERNGIIQINQLRQDAGENQIKEAEKLLVALQDKAKKAYGEVFKQKGVGINTTTGGPTIPEYDTDTIKLWEDYLQLNSKIAQQKIRISDINDKYVKASMAGAKELGTYDDKHLDALQKMEKEYVNLKNTVDAFNASQTGVDKASGVVVDSKANQTAIANSLHDNTIAKIREVIAEKQILQNKEQEFSDKWVALELQKSALRQQISQQEIKRYQDIQKAASTAYDGMIIAYYKYHNEVMDKGAQIENLFTSAFKNIEDAITAFVQTGKLSFKSLFDQIKADLIKMTISKPLTDYIGGQLKNLGSTISSFNFGSSSSATVGPTSLNAAGDSIGGASSATAASNANLIVGAVVAIGSVWKGASDREKARKKFQEDNLKALHTINSSIQSTKQTLLGNVYQGQDIALEEQQKAARTTWVTTANAQFGRGVGGHEGMDEWKAAFWGDVLSGKYVESGDTLVAGRPAAGLTGDQVAAAYKELLETQELERKQLKAKQELTNNNLKLQELELRGKKDSLEYTTILASVREAEMFGMDKSAQAIQRRINLLKDEQNTLDKLLTYQKWQVREMQVSGLDTSLFELRLSQEEEMRLALASGLDVQRLRILQDKEWAKAVENVTGVIKQSLTSVTDLKQAALDIIQKKLEVLATKGSIESGSIGDLSPEDAYKKAVENFDTSYANKDYATISNNATALLSTSRAYNASSEAYQLDLKKVMGALQEMGAPTEGDTSDTQTMISKLIDIKNALNGDNGNDLYSALGSLQKVMEAYNDATRLASINANIETSNKAVAQFQTELATAKDQYVRGEITLAQYNTATDITASPSGAWDRYQTAKSDVDAYLATEGADPSKLNPLSVPNDRDTQLQLDSAIRTAAYKKQEEIVAAKKLAWNSSDLTEYNKLIAISDGYYKIQNSTTDYMTQLVAGLEAANYAKAANDILIKNVYPLRDAYYAELNILNKMPQFATGTSSVPYDMVANIHQGEIIMDRQSSDVLRKYGIPTSGAADNKGVEERLDRMEALFKAMLNVNQAGLIRIADSTERTASAVGGIESKTKLQDVA